VPLRSLRDGTPSATCAPSLHDALPICSLRVNGNLQMTSGATFSLRGGTLPNATVSSGSTLALTGGGGYLTGVTIASGATVDATQDPGRPHEDSLHVPGGLALDRTTKPA